MSAKFKQRDKTESAIKQALRRKNSESVNDLLKDDCFLISFRHLDNNQSNSFESWQESNMLSKFLDVLSNYTKSSLVSQLDGDKFTKYQSFPPNSEFTCPSYIPEDAAWARIHVTGTHIIAGHIVGNIFYVVFLDADHKFWPSKKKNT